MVRSVPNLRIRLFLFSLLVASPILIVAVDSYLAQRRQAVETAQIHLRNMANTLSRAQSQNLQQTRVMVLALGYTLYTTSPAASDCSRLLQELVSHSNHLVHLGVLDSAGQPLCLSSPDYAVSTFPNGAIIQRAIADASFVYGPLDIADAPQSFLAIAAPLHNSAVGSDGDTGNQPQNTLIGLIDLNALSRPLMKYTAGTAYDFVLFDEAGDIIFAPISPDASVENPAGNSAVAETDRSALLPALPLPLSTLQLATHSVQTLDSNALTEPFLYTVTEIRCPGAFSPLFLGISMSEDVAYQAFSQLWQRFALSLGVIAASLLVITWFGGDLLVKRQTEATLQQSERRYRDLFNKMLDGFALHEIIYDKDGNPADYRFLEVNPAFEQITGLQASDLVGKTVREVLPGMETAWIQRYSAVTVLGESLQHEDYTQTLDQHYKVVAFSPQKDQLATIFSDVTVQKHAEDEIRRHADRAQALLRMGQHLNKLHDLDTIYRIACEETADALNVSAVSISLYDEQSGMFRHAADTGLPAGYAQRVRPVNLAHVQRVAKRCPATFIDPDGGTIIVRMDVLQDEKDPNAELYAEFDIRSIVSSDLMYGGECIGRINLHVIGVERTFDAADVALLRGFANETTQAIANARLIRQIRRQAEQLEQIVNTVPEGLLFLDHQYRVILSNEAAHKIFADLYDDGLPEYLTRLGSYALAELRITAATPQVWHEVEFADRRMHIEAAVWPLSMGENSAGWLLVIRDVTVERQERKLQQAKDRLATVGQLAAGVAHDFNNILTPILLYTETTMRRLPEESRSLQSLKHVLQAANRARALVSQILIFSRRGSPEDTSPGPIQPVLKEAIKLIRAVLPATIEIRQEFAQATANAMADPTHIHQIVMNLCANAHHAMRDQGGTLTIGLHVVDVGPESERALADLPPGPYVCISVADTGTGIDPETLEHIFEPFFTTKSVGEGTGMGLSVVYGIVKSSGGQITVNSQLGRGSQFRVYLPRHTQEQPADDVAHLYQNRGNEHVLIVDDEAFVVEAAKQSLEELGYQVTATQRADEALRICAAQPNLFAVAVIDLIMPKMIGLELAERLHELQPFMPVILMSGTDTVMRTSEKRLASIGAVLAKPFSADELSGAIRRVLDAKQPDLLV